MKKVLSLLFVGFLILSSCGLRDECEETDRGNCYCTYEYDPVCGCNGKTYGNPCDAECHGITDYTKGECN